MCSRCLCATEIHGWCYFTPGNLGVGGNGQDVRDEDWDELDALYERVRQTGGDRGVASTRGAKINGALRWAMYADKTRGEQSHQELEARYGATSAPDPQGVLPPLRVIVRAKHDAAEAAAEIRKLGEEFAMALSERLRKERL